MEIVDLQKIMDQCVQFKTSYGKKELEHMILKAMATACEQTVDICSTSTTFDQDLGFEVMDEFTILRVKNQIHG